MISVRVLVPLDEYTRKELVTKSKGSRFSSRVTQDTKYQGLDIDSLLGSKLNYVDMKVQVSGYTCIIRFTEFREVLLEILEDMGLEGYMPDEYENLTPKDKKLAVAEAIDYCVNKSHIAVSCTCPDFKYRFSYKATKDKYNFGFEETRPPVRTNPKLKGSVCKHLVGVLNTPSKWKGNLVRDVIKCIDWDTSVLD